MLEHAVVASHIDHYRQVRCSVAIVLVLFMMLLSGCVAQQADLKKAERDLQQKMRQQDEQYSQARARQSQEISSLREQELPQLHGELEKVRHEAQELHAKQEDLKHRSAQLELQTKKLEQLAAKLEADSNTRYAWLQKSLDTQDAKVNARLDKMSEDVSKAIDGMKEHLAGVVKKTNEDMARRVDLKLDEQQKGAVESQHRLDQVSQKFTQFNQALTGFKEALNGLNERVGQEEQASKGFAAKLDASSRETTAYVNEANKSTTAYVETVKKSVDSVARTLDAMNQKVVSRFEDQDRRLDALTRSVDQVGQKTGGRQPNPKHVLRSQPAPSVEVSGVERASQEFEQSVATSQSPAFSNEDSAAAATPPAMLVAPVEAPQAGEPARASVAADREQYEQVLGLFRGGDLDGARRGFSAFLASYPNSDLAPNARYWLGEAYYGAKDYKKAIDAYDKVELDYPRSEKVPAAILKKGYAYLALKDKKRASSAFKQVVTLYPRTPEAGKASDKLAQLKEGR